MENLTADNINSYVKKGKVMVLFYADWCPFCRAFLKTIEQNKGRVRNNLVGARVNEDENPLWDMFNVKVIPTLVGFRDGKVAARKDGISGVGLGRAELLAVDETLG